MFAVSMNSKLRREGIADGRVRLTNMQQPARTVIFQESGLPGEEALRGQDASKYNGQSKSFANRTAARYAGRAHLIFGDGHVELLDAKDVVTPDGKAFYPQISDQGGKVLWTLDPEMDANKNK
jgi:prepilin-type processing-associated H-X9-DG protein